MGRHHLHCLLRPPGCQRLADVDDIPPLGVVLLQVCHKLLEVVWHLASCLPNAVQLQAAVDWAHLLNQCSQLLLLSFLLACCAGKSRCWLAVPRGPLLR